MSRNMKKARITRISEVKADRSLEERVAALEKQLTDMQAKVSCELDSLSSRIVTVENFNR
ncbi:MULTISPECIES: hypothetical protein [Providencia]|uniref:hypothetical protein n=1 Tax=Providencia TaxID=586 RepID=UPI0019D0309F|nr:MULTISPECIES: hypothetical protein [Providencia]MBN6365545.1 hypothetical protein [Providencia rettgeri]